jgi:hypothetical protein
MNKIYFFSHEINEIEHLINITNKKLYMTETIVSFLKLNGRNSFDELVVIQPFPCCFCEEENHLLHKNKYSMKILNKVLEPLWFPDIYVRFFLDVEINDFFNWLNTYIIKYVERVENLEFIEISF